jgi:hypothetical protein
VLWLARAQFFSQHDICLAVLHAADPLLSRCSPFPSRLSLIYSSSYTSSVSKVKHKAKLYSFISWVHCLPLLRQLASKYMQRSQGIAFTIRTYCALVVRAQFSSRHDIALVAQSNVFPSVAVFMRQILFCLDSPISSCPLVSRSTVLHTLSRIPAILSCFLLLFSFPPG